jgi:general secretion pathway protein G
MIEQPVNQKTRQLYRDRGFTLIELLITVAIVATLTSIALPMNELVVQRNKEQELSSALRQIREAIDAYKLAADGGRIEKLSDQSGYPRSLEELVAGVEAKNDPQRRRVYFLRKIPRDPFVQDTEMLPEQTWGKRSYESRPDAPQEGSDIFDVYTLATGTGLNGIPYREW